MTNLRVSVTGATGFVGRALVTRLLADGAAVKALARPSPRADALEAMGVEVVRGNLANAEAIARAVSGAEVVYHTAAKVSGPGTRKEFIETNAGGTQRVLEACLQQTVTRVVYLSSIAVYGLAQEGRRIDENTPFDERPEARDPYSHSKILADSRAMAFARETGLPLTILREGLVYGPGRSLPVALLGFRAGKTDFVFGNRQNRIPLNYVDNLVDAMVLASRFGGSELCQYILMDDDDLTLNAYHKIRGEIEHASTLFFSGWPVLASATVADAARLGLSIGQREGAAFSAYQVKRALQDRWYDSRQIREATGWSPKVSLREAIERTTAQHK
jgi:nucleoside-diphosphate-sugar epimerase